MIGKEWAKCPLENIQIVTEPNRRASKYMALEPKAEVVEGYNCFQMIA